MDDSATTADIDDAIPLSMSGRVSERAALGAWLLNHGDDMRGARLAIQHETRRWQQPLFLVAFEPPCQPPTLPKPA